MIVRPECVPCYLTQVLSALGFAGVSDQAKNEILYEMAAEIPSLSRHQTPSYNSTLILRKTYERLGSKDPYASAKRESNLAAKDVVQKILSSWQDEPEPVLTALKLAVAGNVIDLGIQTGYDIDTAVKQAMQSDLDKDAYQEFLDMVGNSRSILIIGDNSGEIVFDQILVIALGNLGKQVLYSVKSAPIINDATMEDAVETGMDRLVPIIETGSGFLGVEWDMCSDEFRRKFNEADMVLAKGQANYESLEGCSHAGNKTFFLLKAKCPCVAENLGVKLGDWVLRRNQPS